MAIITIDKDAITEYIPEQERASENPCIVGLRYVPLGRVNDYARMIQQRTSAETRGMKSEAQKVQVAGEIALQVQKRQFTDNVAWVKNYFIGDREVTDAGEFYESADAGLVYEIINAMQDSAKLTEGQRKNSPGPSATA